MTISMSSYKNERQLCMKNLVSGLVSAHAQNIYMQKCLVAGKGGIVHGSVQVVGWLRLKEMTLGSYHTGKCTGLPYM